MKEHIRKTIGFIKNLGVKFRKNFSPGPVAISGATAGLFIGFAITVIVSTWLMLHFAGPGVVLIFILALLIASFLLGFLGFSLIKLISRIPFWLAVAMIAGIPGIVLFFGLNGPSTLLVFFFFALSFALVGGGIWLIRQNWHYARNIIRVLMIVSVLVGSAGLLAGVVWLSLPGADVEMPVNASMRATEIPAESKLENPARRGPYKTGYLTYGSGSDKRRPEYGEQADLITESVDGSTFLDSWKGMGGKLRTRYFGFDQKELPLNARVWYPDADGSFPLVLIVHGNHLAQDFSDPGYEYLGQLLASRGYIMASVDQNFLNGTYTNIIGGLNNENDARGWLLLKHIELWQNWNNDQDNLFYDRVDMENIALIGHSRGGEAAAHAALFNTLPFYPDDATETFDFNFSIKAVIAIAPSDGQYQPASIRTPLHNINYLVLQGSHDADVSSFQGLRQFNRIAFSDDFDGFKAGVYIWAANHGQFNSVWGSKDGASPRINFFNLGQLLDEEDQQTIAEVFMSAFLEAHLRNNDGYRAIFRDSRKARHWLPETIYITQFEEAGTRFVGTFQEDLDVSTASLPGSTICTRDLSTWREESLSLNWGNYDSRAVILGWNTRESDTLQPAFKIKWDKGVLPTSRDAMLVFSAADTGGSADPPFSNASNNTINNNAENKTESDSSVDDESDSSEEEEPTMIDFTIRLSDASGQIIEFPLSRCSFLQTPLERQLTKLAFMQTAASSETILQHFYFPLKWFADDHPDFDFENITGIGFYFNIVPHGVVAVNNIGFI